MEKFLTLNKNYLLFLCQDQNYGENIEQVEEPPTFVNPYEMKLFFEQKLRF